MMTKKSEMAEWILDFFRRANLAAGQVILFRNMQNKLYTLNLKEREMFVPVLNELIENKYFTFEEGVPQYLRLTEKGGSYIYDPQAELDCCRDIWMPNRRQSQYLAAWHDSFVEYIDALLSTILALEGLPEATEEDRRGLGEIKQELISPDVNEIKANLASGIVNKGTIDGIAELNEKILNICIDHMRMSPLVQLFWKKMAHMRVEQDKEAEMKRLSALQIPVEGA